MLTIKELGKVLMIGGATGVVLIAASKKPLLTLGCLLACGAGFLLYKTGSVAEKIKQLATRSVG